MKTNKTFTSRVKITKTGKLKVRIAGQNHFNAKESRRAQFGKKGYTSVVIGNKTLSRYTAGK